MDKEYNQAAERNADELARQIEQAIPDARIKNLGWLIVVILPNKSTFTLNLLSTETVDVAGEDCTGRHWDLTGASWQQALGVLVQVNGLMPATIGEDRERDQRGRKDARRDFPFGEDPLGEKELHERPNKRSEGRRKTETGHNYAGGSPLALNESGSSSQLGSREEIQERNVIRMPYGAELFQHLGEVLPVSEDEMFIDDAGNFNVVVDPVRMRIIPKGINLYDIETFIGDDREPEQVQLSYGDTIQWAFDLFSAVEKVNAAPAVPADDGSEDVEPSGAYEVLREMAGELGKPKDIIRNKDLINLRAGLLTEGKNHSTAPDALLCGLDAHLRKYSDLKGDRQGGGTNEPPKVKWFRGAPVSIREGMDGKALRYIEGAGAVIVENTDLPPSDNMKLSWTPDKGAVLVPSAEITKRPCWKPHGWKS
jgi:hypothetical protein